ncbi:MAG: 4-hydroxythreonine-4-phosphate dehydrogenase PdxA [Candidatus Krumholzibacteriota bacterium]|nr:4-hydroxythreonine-4-phosphate dehydrogenase PdxA [Candidatus Krumholzibacteriota bacterium]
MLDKITRLALTIGDPGGIGPELTAAFLNDYEPKVASIYLLGSAPSLRGALRAETRKRLEVIEIREAEEGRIADDFPLLIDVAEGLQVPPGRPSAEGGLISGKAVEAAVSLARKGLVDAIVTGPVSKEALRLGGYPYRGHTDMLGDLFQAPDCQMLMVSGNLRILILTRDIPLREVPGEITQEKIVRAVRVADGAMKRLWGIRKPRILCAALNPHAGDGGLLGTEEREVVRPAIERLKAEGVIIEGPVPADTLFLRGREKDCDLFVALYHDQGMIPFKANGFERGVNMTIGLPVIRTSVCHGTAYDIAGKGVARTGSLREAVSLAVSCSRRTRPSIGVNG